MGQKMNAYLMGQKMNAYQINRYLGLNRVLEKFGIQEREGFIKCPAHEDESPSLKLYGNDKGWFCFSCQKGGGAVEFYQLKMKYSKRSAIKVLKQIFNIDIKNTPFDFKIFHLNKTKHDSSEALIQRWHTKLCRDIGDFMNDFDSEGWYHEQLYGAWIFMEDYIVELCKNAESLAELESASRKIKNHLINVLRLCIEVKYRQYHDDS
jgi:hypothetical protein